ncbi:MAG: (2Fe-2S)-binding protein [Acidobacteriota bacterium]
MSENIFLTVNGRQRKVKSDSDVPLLLVLRNDLELNGPKFGCGLGQCGFCTVLLDGAPVRSCVTPLSEAQGKEITTLEGLSEGEELHPVQQAFLQEQAAQCGYCTNGMIMVGKALLDHNPNPSEEEIRRALTGNLCRCATHLRIIRAIKRAAREVSGNA